MGTRSITIIRDDDGSEIIRIYRQFDGYPDGMGLELAKLCNVKVVNGIGGDAKAGTHANGLGCLAAQIVAGLKTTIGNVYLEKTGGEISDWVEYVYTIAIDPKDKSRVLIDCSTNAGAATAWPFNTKTKSGRVFCGTAAQWIKKYDKVDA